MTDQRTRTIIDGGRSRRRLLRDLGTGAGAFAVGVVGASEPVAATWCPKPPEYWADHEWPDTRRVSDPLTLAGERRRIANWKLLLVGDPPEAPAGMVARQLLATRLNFQHRPTDDPDCVDRPLPALDDRTVRAVVIAAVSWLRASDWPADGGSWVVDGVDGGPLYDALGAFNHGKLEALDCDCGGVRDGSTDWENPRRRDDRSRRSAPERTIPEGL